MSPAKKIFISIALLLWLPNIVLGEEIKYIEGSGFDLLNKVSESFQNLTEKTDKTTRVKYLNSLIPTAKKSLKEKRFDPLFYKRFVQLIRVCQLCLQYLDNKTDKTLEQTLLTELKKLKTAEEDDGQTTVFILAATTIPMEIIDLGKYLKKKEYWY